MVVVVMVVKMHDIDTAAHIFVDACIDSSAIVK